MLFRLEACNKWCTTGISAGSRVGLSYINYLVEKITQVAYLVHLQMILILVVKWTVKISKYRGFNLVANSWRLLVPTFILTNG